MFSPYSKLQIKIFICTMAVGGMALAGPARAVRIFPEVKSFQENGKNFFEISAFLDTEDEGINVLAGEMRYPAGDLVFEKTTTGGSIANLWFSYPAQASAGGVNFIGGIPNGYAGKKGFIFSAVFSPTSATASDQVKISFQNISAYLNNGAGTEKKLSDTAEILNLAAAEKIAPPSDTEPPEVFAPYVTSDPQLEGGRWVVIFNAQDKGSGLDYYEVFESKERHDAEAMISDKSLSWQPVKGVPIYILNDQELKSYIYVKAVDKAGNIRIAEVVPARDRQILGFDYKFFLAAILIILLGALAFWGFRSRKKESPPEADLN